jgi:hemerythrin-like metal-binding protein
MNDEAATTNLQDVAKREPQLRPRSFFVWKDTFRLGIAAVDRDHQRFFELINRLHDCMALGKDEAVVRATLAALVDYAREHFVREEKELDDLGYPHLAQHEAEHRHFLQELYRIARQPTAAARPAVALAREWLLEHTLKTDKQYAVWFASKGRG